MRKRPAFATSPRLNLRNLILSEPLGEALSPDTSVFEGNALSNAAPARSARNAICAFPGIDAHGRDISLPISESLLSTHMLILGGIGMGKSNAFFHLLSQLQKRLTQDDVMIVFDTKGDYHQNFYRPGIDVVISNDDKATGPKQKDYWNIFREIDVDDRLEENTLEIAKTLFCEKINRSSQPFFPNAAKDILSAILSILPTFSVMRGRENNAELRNFLDQVPPDRLHGILEGRPEFRALASYIAPKAAGQAQGVFSEMQQLAREVFMGNFRRKGTMSMRRLVREKRGRIIFVEYDLGIGQVLSPAYRLLFDLAIKEALCRREGERGNVYFFMDEFRLIPLLQHVDDGVNFGRSLGAKFVIGVQNIGQVYNAYTEPLARSLLSGFNTLVAFRVHDEQTRRFVKDVFGANRKRDVYMSTVQTRGVVENVRDAQVVEDWDILNLGRGDAIIGLPSSAPFRFHFKRYSE